jgi:hypothetical protein
LRMIPDHILFERKRYLGRERVVIIEKGVLWEMKGNISKWPQTLREVWVVSRCLRWFRKSWGLQWKSPYIYEQEWLSVDVGVSDEPTGGFMERGCNLWKCGTFGEEGGDLSKYSLFNKCP